VRAAGRLGSWVGRGPSEIRCVGHCLRSSAPLVAGGACAALLVRECWQPCRPPASLMLVALALLACLRARVSQTTPLSATKKCSLGPASLPAPSGEASTHPHLAIGGKRCDEGGPQLQPPCCRLSTLGGFAHFCAVLLAGAPSLLQVLICRARAVALRVTWHRAREHRASSRCCMSAPCRG